MSEPTLRWAAELMRERAEAARPFAFRTPVEMASWACDGSLITSTDTATCEHYAPLSPATGLAIADWLDGLADRWAHDATGSEMDAGVTVARAYFDGWPQ